MGGSSGRTIARRVARLVYSQLHVSQDDGMKSCLKNQTKTKQHTISKHFFSYQFPFDFCIYQFVLSNFSLDCSIVSTCEAISEMLYFKIKLELTFLKNWNSLHDESLFSLSSKREWLYLCTQIQEVPGITQAGCVSLCQHCVSGLFRQFSGRALA